MSEALHTMLALENGQAIERAAIVAWLRRGYHVRNAAGMPKLPTKIIRKLADEIESGAHHLNQGKE